MGLPLPPTEKEAFAWNPEAKNFPDLKGWFRLGPGNSHLVLLVEAPVAFPETPRVLQGNFSLTERELTGASDAVITSNLRACSDFVAKLAALASELRMLFSSYSAISSVDTSKQCVLQYFPTSDLAHERCVHRAECALHKIMCLKVAGVLREALGDGSYLLGEPDVKEYTAHVCCEDSRARGADGSGLLVRRVCYAGVPFPSSIRFPVRPVGVGSGKDVAPPGGASAGSLPSHSPPPYGEGEGAPASKASPPLAGEGAPAPEASPTPASAAAPGSMACPAFAMAGAPSS